MTQDDLLFVDSILNDASWLFYGELDRWLQPFMKMIFSRELSHWGFIDIDEKHPEFMFAYWLFLSELVRLDLAEYGTSPRGAWLTPKGERFKKIVMENDNLIEQIDEFQKV